MILAKSGNPIATIVTCSEPSEGERRAAEQLQAYLGKMICPEAPKTGMLDMGREDSIGEGQHVYVGHTHRAAKMKTELVDLREHSFLIRSVDDGLVLCGRDDLGTEYAVYTLLEQYLGVRWLWPGELGEHVPHRPTVEIGRINDIQEPAFELTIFGRDPDWRRHNKLLRRVQFQGGHEWGRLLPPSEYGPTHPEYYALVDGTREKDWEGYDGQHGYQLCTSNPEVIRVCVEKVREFFDQHPEVGLYAIGANDGLGFCECEQCVALGVGSANDPDAADRPPGRWLSDRIYEFTNAIAAEVGKTHPNRYIVQFAYGVYADPLVEVKPLANVVPWITLNCEACYIDRHKRMQWDRMRQWVNLSRHMFIYEYFNHTWKLELPRAMPTAIAEAISFYKSCGTSWFYAQSGSDFFNEGLDYYLVAKLLWNPNLDVSALVDDYCRAAFGSAVDVMKTYYGRLEECWADSVRGFDPDEFAVGTPNQYLAMFTPPVMDELRGYLDKALELAEEGPFRDRVNFMLDGWRFVELETEAFRLLLQLVEEGVVLGYRPAGWVSKAIADLTTMPRPKIESLVRKTLAVWDERSAYVEQLKDKSIIDYRHTTGWNCTDFRFHPVAALKEAMAKAGW